MMKGFYSMNPNSNSNEFIIHPGESLKEWMVINNWTSQKLAANTNVSLDHILGILEGFLSITPKFADSLENATNTPASFWL